MFYFCSVLINYYTSTKLKLRIEKQIDRTK